MGRLKTVYIRRFNISEIVEMLRIFFVFFPFAVVIVYLFRLIFEEGTCTSGMWCEAKGTPK